MNELQFVRTPARLADVSQLRVLDDPSLDSLPLAVRLVRIIKRRKWLLLGSILAALLLGVAVTFLMTPLYTASATIEIQRENDRIAGVQGVQADTAAIDMEFYQTQYGLLASRSLAERVATELRLYDNADFFDIFGAADIAETLRERQRSGPGDRQQRIKAAADILLANLDVAPARISRLVDVKFTSPNPTLSADVANAWTRHFVELTLARRYEATAHARRFLEQRLAQLRQRLEQSERALVGYAGRERIINIPTQNTTGGENGLSTTERPLVADDLAALNQELNKATADRISAQSRLVGSGGSTVEGLENQAISVLRARRAELAGEYARLMTQFEPGYPAANNLQNQIGDLDRSIAREEARVRNTIQGTYAAAVGRESALKARVQGLQGELLNLRGRTIQYNIYQREVDTNRQLYDALLQRFKEIGVAGGIGINNISVVDPAEVPATPSSPNLLLNVLMSLILGALIGTGCALALEQIDDALSEPSDVERLLGLPLLGAIPKSSEGLEVALEDPKSPLVEAYLSSQTSLAFTTDHGVPKTFTVTSTRPAEGKSTTSYALARSLARGNRSVILVDADMRSPSQHQIFGLENGDGLSNYLAGTGDLSRMIHRNLREGVALLTAGPLPPNAAELLTGTRLSDLLEVLSAEFDHIILDAPPVMGLADTPLIASKVEGVVFVIESHSTRTRMARVAVNRLNDVSAHLLGALMTKFESRKAHGYGYEYGYGYGEKVSSEV